MMIRPATEADAEGCTKVMVRAMSTSADYGKPKVSDIYDQSKSRIAGYLAGTYYPGFARDERQIFVGEEQGEVVGFVAGQRTLRFACDGELQWAFVLPEWERRGIGESLLASIRQWFVSQGLKKVCVNSPEAMSTRAFYLKQGASVMNEHWCVWEDIGSVKR
jgi:GNAT superfamily N-acetyltransferase